MFSTEISHWIQDKFPVTYNTIDNNAQNAYFTIFSALGGNPLDGKLEKIEPRRILDPIFLTLKSEGFY